MRKVQKLLVEMGAFVAVCALFAFVHTNPPSPAGLEFVIDALLLAGLFAVFALMHHLPASREEI